MPILIKNIKTWTPRKMNIWDRYANFVYRVATGRKKLKMVITLPVAVLFFGLVSLFVLASIWVDKSLLFFHFDASWWTLSLSIILLSLGWLVCLWTALSFLRNRGTPVPFNPPLKLIITGLYSHIRNPMLLGLFIFMLGLGVLFGSLSLIFIFTPLFVLVNVLYLKAIEEKEMEKKFGAEYVEYKKKVPMFIPKFAAIWKTKKE
ncbi:methyltransferase family protein [Chloroflexota bacterium]